MENLNNMRKYHNYIKRHYIDKYAKSNTKLLDLATGKGGDLSKWKYNDNIIRVEGYDFNASSIKEAIRRRNNLKIQKPIFFKVLDLSKEVLNCKKKFELITINFAFHYFFKNRETLDTILQTLNNCSKKGTKLIITILDGDKIKDVSSVETENYYIKKINKNSKSNYGREIEVFIKNAVLDKPEIEYIVKPSFLIMKLKSIGFILEETKSFEEIFDKKFNLTEQEKNFSFLNRIFIFSKE